MGQTTRRKNSCVDWVVRTLNTLRAEHERELHGKKVVLA